MKDSIIINFSNYYLCAIPKQASYLLLNEIALLCYIIISINSESKIVCVIKILFEMLGPIGTPGYICNIIE